jgi:superfamily I DNA/RNA helicase
MGWYVPFDKLGQKQLEVLNGITGQLDRPHWVQGFAGTGKTLVVTHLMERVAKLKPSSSICFVTFTHALKDLVSGGLQGAVARRVEIKTHTQYLRERQHYDYVFLDEVQDISPSDLVKIKGLAGNLYVAGDGDQRIYDKGASEQEITAAVSPRTWKLLEIFRLTKLLQQVAQAILPRTKLIEGLHSSKDAEVTIRLMQHADSSSEAQWVWKEAKRRARPADPSVILFPTHEAIASFAVGVAASLSLDEPPCPPKPPKGKSRDYGPFNEFWDEEGVNLMYFGNNHGELTKGETEPMVYLMTFHSSKGLDFRNVFIPGMRDGATIVSQRALENDTELDRRLLFVAVTRSRENLFISYSGRKAHPLLKGLPASVVANVTPVKAKRDDDEEEFF